MKLLILLAALLLILYMAQRRTGRRPTDGSRYLLCLSKTPKGSVYLECQLERGHEDQHAFFGFPGRKWNEPVYWSNGVVNGRQAG